MKKTLIAVAALAATTAFAQNVTVIGTVDATYRSTTVDYGNGTSGGQNAIGQNGSGTSNFTLVGTEDLGGGLKAIFNTEFDFNAGGQTTAIQNSTTTIEGPIGGGQLFVGLEGAFGSIKLGKPNSPTLTVQGSRSAFGTKDGGRVGVATSAGIATSSGGSVMGTSVTRTAGSILYTTPNFSGFSAQLDYAPGAKTEAGIAETGATTDIGAFYANGPIAAGVTRYTEAAAGAASEKGLTSYYGSYNFGVAKVTLGGHQYKQDSAGIDNAGYGAAVDAPLSPALTLSAHLVKVDDKAVADLDKTMMAVGLNYALSKRTSTYVRYVSEKADNATTAAQIKTGSEYLVGVRHNF
ncbi:MAG: porin [Hylemonella sp.]